MPALPISKNQLDKLGDRLRDAAVPAPSDLDLLEAVLGTYDEALQAVSTTLRRLGLHPTVRLKTTGTIIDKLRRDRASSLKTIQDLAGARVVVKGTLNRQDALVRDICDAYADSPHPPVVIDRRVDPRAGYRAIHVILRVAGVPVEVQLRTEHQDLWAQIFERLADVWGRQIRYGGEPDDDSDPAVLARRRNTVATMMKLSELMGQHESMRAMIEQENFPKFFQDAGVDLAATDESVPAEYRQVRSNYRMTLARDAEIDQSLRELLVRVAEEVEEEVRSR